MHRENFSSEAYEMHFFYCRWHCMAIVWYIWVSCGSDFTYDRREGPPYWYERLWRIQETITGRFTLMTWTSMKSPINITGIIAFVDWFWEVCPDYIGELCCGAFASQMRRGYQIIHPVFAGLVVSSLVRQHKMNIQITFWQTHCHGQHSLQNGFRYPFWKWSLHPLVFHWIRVLWGHLLISIFAKWLTHKLPIFVSPVVDPEA